MAGLSAWAWAFALTQIVEVPIYRAALGPRRGAWLIAFGASMLTHPFIFLALPRSWGGDWTTYFWAAEAVAVLGEALWLRAFRLRAPLFWAQIANTASVAVGWTTRALWAWP
jgi:hypothetical protein